jgi:hypothetical protein
MSPSLVVALLPSGGELSSTCSVFVSNLGGLGRSQLQVVSALPPHAPTCTALSSASAVSDPSTTLNTIARAWPCLAGLGTSEVPAVTCKPTSPSGEALLTRLAAFHSPRRRRPVSPGLRRPAGRRVRLGQRFEDRSWASLALYKYSTQVHHRCERHPDGRCAAPRGGRDGPAKRPSRPCVSAGHHLVHRCGLDDQVWRSRRG